MSLWKQICNPQLAMIDDEAYEINKQMADLDQMMQTILGLLHKNSLETQQWSTELSAKRSHICLYIAQAIERLAEIQTVVITKRLHQWKRDQILSAYGDWMFVAPSAASPLDANSKNEYLKMALDKIQMWFARLLNFIMKLRTWINFLINSNHPGNVHAQFEREKFKDTEKLLKDLISKCLIIETQPRQVIQKDTR